jgi:glycerol kinase
VAGLTVGLWSSEDEIRSLWAEDRRFEPTMDAAEKDRLLAEWEKGIERSFGWV